MCGLRTTMMSRSSAHRERGGALLAVLWMSAALAAIAFSLASTIRNETNRATSDADGLRAAYLATGSVERGIQWMLWGPDYRNQDGSPRFWVQIGRASCRETGRRVEGGV